MSEIRKEYEANTGQPSIFDGNKYAVSEEGYGAHFTDEYVEWLEGKYRQALNEIDELQKDLNHSGVMVKIIRANDYMCEWTEKKYKGGKELGDWTADEVAEFAEDFARKKFMEENRLDEEDMINDNKPPQEL